MSKRSPRFRFARHVAVLIAVTSCQYVFPREGADVAEDPCTSQSTDPLRYAKITGGYNVSDASGLCQRLGMDLVVFDTAAEFAAVHDRGTPPYWTGVFGTPGGMLGDFSAKDECVPFLDFEPPQPTIGNGCVLVDNSFRMRTEDCASVLIETNLGISPLCETPVPSQTCAQILPGPYSVGSEAAVPYATAAGTCHDIVEINTPDELRAVAAFAADHGINEFWVAPQFDGTSWNSPDGCPSVFDWVPGQPLLSQFNCAVFTRGVGMSTHDCMGSAQVICEH